jgi:hypothetical protein
MDKCAKKVEICAYSIKITNQAKIWHKRLGHLNYHNLQFLSNMKRAFGILKLPLLTKTCPWCLQGKQHSKRFTYQNYHVANILYILHIGIFADPWKTLHYLGLSFLCLSLATIVKWYGYIFPKAKCSEFKYVNNGFKIVDVLYGHQVNKLFRVVKACNQMLTMLIKTRLYSCTIL